MPSPSASNFFIAVFFIILISSYRPAIRQQSRLSSESTVADRLWGTKPTRRRPSLAIPPSLIMSRSVGRGNGCFKLYNNHRLSSSEGHVLHSRTCSCLATSGMLMWRLERQRFVPIPTPPRCRSLQPTECIGCICVWLMDLHCLGVL